ncbi:MAG: GNAT family N-acetyltransferase [Pseudohongiellaceae bacterium]
MENLEVKFVESIEDIGLVQWNSLTGIENPFTRYEFLHALETTGCTTAQTGWAPLHLAVYKKRQHSGEQPTENPAPLAVLPLYVKDNSWGEYVFDWSWANAYQNHNLNYYPKLVTAVPFTPSVGKRLFISSTEELKEETLLAFIVKKIKEKALTLEASSWHVLFPVKTEAEGLHSAGMLSRRGTQFQWRNRHYRSFDEFLSTLNSRKRKSIRKERKRVQDVGITFRRTEGLDISEAQWEEFYGFYQSTYLMRGQQGYLSSDFFKRLAEVMPEQLLLINASKEGRDIAAALFFKNNEALFGRYWGSDADYQFLHFETCYYQGQDYAIEHSIGLFDSGAQGEHKIQRGFEPVVTHSTHWLAHPGFAEAVENFLKEESLHVDQYKASAETLLPFKNLSCEPENNQSS